MHERLASAYAEAGDDADPFARVEHEALAGRPREAMACAIAGAERALASFAFSLASSLFEHAITQHPAVIDPGVDAAELHIRYGRALVADGRSIAGSRAVLRGIELRIAAAGDLADDESTSRQWRLSHMLYAAEHLLRGGVREEGVAIMRSALDLAGVRWHDSDGRAIGSIIWNRARLRVRRWFFRDYDVAAAPASEAQSRALEAIWSAGVGLSYYEPLRAFDYQARHARLAEVTRDPGHLARAHATEAMLSGLSRGPRADVAAARHYALAVTLAQRAGMAEVDAHVRSMGTAFAYNSWTFETTIVRARETVAFCKEFCPRARWEIAGATWLEACAQGKLGRLDEQADTATRGLREAERLGDRYQQITLDMGPSTLYRLAADHPDEALARADMARTLCGQSGFLDYLHAFTVVRCHLYAGEPELAIEGARRAWAEIVRTRMHGIAVIRVEMLDLLARAELANGALDRAARWAARLHRVPHPAAQAQGLFLKALINDARGHGDRARREFVAAAVALDGLGLQPEGKLARHLSGAQDLEQKISGACELLAAHQVQRPSAYLAMLAPGLQHIERPRSGEPQATH